MDKKKEFAQIYKGNIAIVYRYVYARIFNKSETEDVTSQVFLTAYEKFMKEDFEELKNPKTWLIQIARNVMGNRIQKKKYEVPQLEDVQFEDKDLPLEDVVVTESQVDQIKKYFKKLDADTREIISLKIWERYKFKEIAELMDTNESTVKTLYYRGIKKVRNDMKTAKEFAVVIVGLQTLGKQQIFVPSVAFIKAAITKISLDVAKMALTKTITILGKIVSLKSLIIGTTIATVGLGAAGTGTAVYVNERMEEQDTSVVEEGREIEEVKNDEVAEEQEESEETVSTNESQGKDYDDKSNWETYVNKEMGFKISYPNYIAAMERTNDSIGKVNCVVIGPVDGEGKAKINIGYGPTGGYPHLCFRSGVGAGEYTFDDYDMQIGKETVSGHRLVYTGYPNEEPYKNYSFTLDNPNMDPETYDIFKLEVEYYFQFEDDYWDLYKEVLKTFEWL